MGTATPKVENAQLRDYQPEVDKAQALDAVLSCHLSSFHRQAFRRLGNAADAEDAVQDALLSAYKHLEQFKGQARMSTWLSTIVLNCARIQLRRRQRYTHVSLDDSPEGMNNFSLQERLADRGLGPEDAFRRSEFRKHLNECLQRLPSKLRTAVHLRSFEGLSIREIASNLGTTESTVKARLFRARAALRDLARKLEMEHSAKSSCGPHCSSSINSLATEVE
jgi:RNA polymerase sigma-70 factor, ECF subfamily